MVDSLMSHKSSKKSQQSHQNERGFALPITLLVGVLITGVGLAMVTRSRADQSKAVTQRVKAEGLSISEVAVTQLQNLLDSNRLLSMYSMGDWASLNPTAPDNLKTPFQLDLEYETEQKIKSVNNNGCSTSSTTNMTAIDGEVQTRLRTIKSIGSSDWQVLPDGQGSYRLIAYYYQGTSGVVNGTQKGFLTVEGRAGVGNAESVSRVSVELPVIQQPTDNLFAGPNIPGLWISEGATNDRSQSIGSNGSYNGGANFSANVVMSDKCSFNSTQQTNIAFFPVAATAPNSLTNSFPTCLLYRLAYPPDKLI
jgi:hypothetical protein